MSCQGEHESWFKGRGQSYETGSWPATGPLELECAKKAETITYLCVGNCTVPEQTAPVDYAIGCRDVVGTHLFSVLRTDQSGGSTALEN